VPHLEGRVALLSPRPVAVRRRAQFIHGHKIRIFCFVPFREREGIDVGVRSYRAGGLVTLGVPKNRRLKVVAVRTVQ
jgi:hypothetical protein